MVWMPRSRLQSLPKSPGRDAPHCPLEAMDSIPLPMSQSALDAFRALPLSFMLPLTADERRTVLQAFLHLDIASKGTKTPRLLQLRAALAVIAGKDLVVRSGTGSGKTLAMILPVLSLPTTSAIITVSPLRLIQDNHAGVLIPIDD
ncbi:hypothetical protein B0H13DRAFT_2300804 [Mycena leptocephala]|nr:hypothetical protein B0H13DRAFT_2300804 [Mycena leptocephala]